MTLEELYKTIISRKTELPEGSYVASLFKGDEDRIIQKAAKNLSKERLVSETADLLFHILVLLVARGVSLDEVMEELEKRKK